MGTGWVVALAIVAGVVLVVAVAVGGSKAGRKQGYSGMGGDTIVRCSKGHLFTTKWIPGSSFKAVRLGGARRYQHCPVGKHWAVVQAVKDADLTDEDRRLAAEYPASKIP
jgi:hypothetical protein